MIANRRVCILHVGGTIGMVRSAQGLVPGSGAVERYLAAMGELSRPDMPAWELVALEPLLDSADMAPADWVRVADAVVARHDLYDGFVVLHGTDTMVYTASALSFLLRGLRKPVVFTGSQLPLEDPRSDGRAHIVTALLLAATLEIAEPAIYFGGSLLRGNRAQKVNNNDFVAYASGNLPPLANVGVRIDVARHLLRPPASGACGRVPLSGEPVVTALRVFPGLTAELLRRMLAPPLQGLVLETYGAGTFPSRDPALLAVLREAVERGVVIVNCSQCHSGRVRQEAYGTSSGLARAGVTSGHDMTPEAALTKVYCLLAAGHTPEAVRREIEEDLAGEVTVGEG